MCGLKNEQGLSVNAGLYRTHSVMAGNHVFPSFKCVPRNMARIVKEYNEKFTTRHDCYELASWLHYNVVSLHPFEDGNGRISRLLWCYSLMRDGLPFPAVLTSGHKKSQKHYVQCLQRDRDRTFSYGGKDNTNCCKYTPSMARFLRTLPDFLQCIVLHIVPLDCMLVHLLALI